MPSVRYYNRSGPFWDFVADLEDQGANHPLFAAWTGRNGDIPADNPWHADAPAAEGQEMPPPPPPAFEAHEGDGYPNEKGKDNEKDPQEGPSSPREGQGDGSGKCGSRQFRACGGRRGRGGPQGHGCGGRGRGGFGPFGGWGGPGRHYPWGGPGFGRHGAFNLNALAEIFQDQFLNGGDRNRDRAQDSHGAQSEGHTEDFKPAVDIFDTETCFVVHVSLPGVKKEDVGVNWDSDKSELNIAGVVYRPGDEDFLKTLAMDERQVGPFQRNVRLGSRANPAQVDVEGITAKLDDGILRIEVPKEDKDYVEVKKVDIE